MHLPFHTHFLYRNQVYKSHRGSFDTQKGDKNHEAQENLTLSFLNSDEVLPAKLNSSEIILNRSVHLFTDLCPLGSYMVCALFEGCPYIHTFL